MVGTMSEALPLPLTPSERMALEAVEQGYEPSSAMLERLRRQAWVAKSHGGLRLTEAGRQALLNDLSARAARRSDLPRR
jgi:hypothetical protein